MTARQTDNRKATLLMVASMAAFAIEDLFLKRAATDLPPGQVLVLNGVAGATVFWVLAARAGQGVLVRDALRGMALVRMLAEAAGAMLYIVALALVPLTLVSAILQAAPLVVVAGAALFLGEKVGWRRWLSVITGCLGVLVILQPWDARFEPLGLLVVAGVVLLALRDLATRAMPARFGTLQLSTWAYMGTIPAGAALMAIMGQGAVIPAPTDAATLAGALVCGLFGTYAVVAAMRLGEVSVVAPFRYTRLVFAVLLAVAVLGERPEGSTLMGAAIVVGSGLYTFARERARRRLSLDTERG